MSARLVDEARVLVLHLDAEGRVQYVNPYFTELTARARSELLGGDWFELAVPAESRDAARRHFTDGIAGRTDTEVNSVGKILTADGAERDIDWFARLVHDGNGRIVGILAIGADITERVARTAEARRREARLDMAQRIAKIGTWERDRTTHTSWYSEHVFELLGSRPDELPEHGAILARTHPDDRGLLEALYERSRSEPTPFELTHRIITGAGEERWVVQRWSTEFDAHGSPVRSLGTLQDVTERQRIEEELREFRSTLDQTLDSVFIFDAESLRFVYVNRGAMEQIGYDRDRLLEMHPYDVAEEYDEHGFRTLLRPLLEWGDDRLTFEATHVHSSGRRIPVEVSLQLVTSAGSHGRFIAVAHDLTDRRAAERLLREMNVELEQRVAERTAELVEREADLRRAHEIARLGQFSSGRHGEDSEWSDGVYQLLGLDPATTRPGREIFLEMVHPADRDIVPAAIADAVATGTTASFDHRVIRPDGAVRWIHQEVMVDPATGGRPLRLRGTMQDVTERKRVESALIEARHEAERANLAKTEFLSHMSHELRTPLNAVLGFAQVVDDGTLSAEHAEFVHEIQRAGEHLLDMVNELLDLTRIEAGAIHVEPRPVETEVIVAACVASVRPLTTHRSVTIDTDLTEGGMVMADPIRLRQVMLNLLSNAIKYNKAEGSVRVECRDRGDQVRVVVADTGVGIPAEAFEELFTPFARLEATYSGIEGAGIGLALSKRLVEAMGGEIGATSAVGEGSEFWIDLPRPDTVTADDGTAPDPASESGPFPAGRVTVLCVEDNPSNLRLLERIIGARDEFRMLQAQRGDAALRLAVANRPDVVLLDLGLPGIDGYEVLRRLRATPETASIPAIAVTANAIPSEVERARLAGFDGYVSKPFTARGLVDAIQRALGERSD